MQNTLLENEARGVLRFGGARMALLDIAGGFWQLRRQLEALAGRRLTDAAVQQAGVQGGASFARSFVAQDALSLEGFQSCLAGYEAAGFGAFTLLEADWDAGRLQVEGQNTFEAWMVQEHGEERSEPVCAYSAGVLVGFINELTNRQDIVCRERTCQALGDACCTFELLPATEDGGGSAVMFGPDPLLGRELNLLDLLFERMPMGIVIFDKDLRIRRFNPTWASFIEEYTPKRAEDVAPGVHFYDLVPEAEAAMGHLLQRVLEGETLRHDALRSESGGIVSYWDAVFSPVYAGDEVVGILDVTTDATRRVLARQDLELRVTERTREVRQRADEAEALFTVQQAITSRLDPDEVLQMIADAARRLTETEMAAVYLFQGEEFEIAYVSGSVSPEVVGYRLPVAGSLAGLTVERRESVLVADVDQIETGYRQLIDRVSARSLLIVPLLASGGRPVGTITVANRQQGPLGPEAERVLTLMASGAVIALENARLYEEEQARRQEAERRRQVSESLRGILAALNSHTPLPDILNLIVDEADRLLDTTVVALYLLDERDRTLCIEASRGLTSDLIRTVRLHVGEGTVGRVVAKGEPVILEDVAELRFHPSPDAALEDPNGRFVDPGHGAVLEEALASYRAALVAPLRAQDRIHGALALYYPDPRPFSDEEIGLATTFADQAALAIENARLRDSAEQMAVVAERNRLARELHDAVTQTLFSASLIAEVLPKIWERDEEMGRARLAELRELTRGALAEMRTLLLELRPAALTESKLADLLRQLAEAVIGRSRLPVTIEIRGDGQLPPDVKVALYRIAQEALNNVVKHAAAHAVQVVLDVQPDSVALTISDNGRGFDPRDLAPQSLGLGIMRERVERLGASLSIVSEIGQGTSVYVHCPLEPKGHIE